MNAYIGLFYALIKIYIIKIYTIGCVYMEVTLCG
nr:MAG TPA: hypothetical protein [Myoviridae sp. ctNPX13]